MQFMYVRHMLEYCHVLLDVLDLTDDPRADVKCGQLKR